MICILQSNKLHKFGTRNEKETLDGLLTVSREVFYTIFDYREIRTHNVNSVRRIHV